MLPSIPENFYQILFVVGLFLFGYGFLQYKSNEDSFRQDARRFNNLIFEVNNKGKELDSKRKEMLDYSSEISGKYDVKNPILEKDSMMTITHTYRGPKNEVLVSDIITRTWRQYIKAKKEYELFDEKSRRLQDEIDENLIRYQSNINLFSIGIGVGIVIIVLGLLGLINNQVTKDKILRSQLKPDIEVCQSCFKRFGATVQNGKFNDGEINKYYCADCFSNNDFTDPNLKPIDVVLQVMNSYHDDGWIVRRQIKNSVYDLRRWRWDKY